MKRRCGCWGSDPAALRLALSVLVLVMGLSLLFLLWTVFG